MFEGHRLYKIGNDWVFDLTEFIGYKVNVEGSKVESFEKAFTVKRSEDNKSYKFTRAVPIPVGVMRKAKTIIEDYLREALLNG